MTTFESLVVFALFFIVGSIIGRILGNLSLLAWLHWRDKW